MNFYTADLHLGHKNILTSTGRKHRYASVEEMNEDLIRRWNEKVGKDDDIFVLGDLSLKNAVCYLEQMNGHKHLIIGNHDILWMKKVENMSKYFESIAHMDLIKEGKSLITLCHYPMLEWNRSRYAKQQEGSTSWLIHGHIHDSRDCVAYQVIKETLPCALNAGVDINNFEPVTFEELVANSNVWYERN